MAMQRYLWEFRANNIEMTSKVFRATIGKFSIGCNGFGELRNGRWRRKDLMTVLMGFPHTPSGEPRGQETDHHMGSFLIRDDWQFYHGWIQILAYCRATAELWKEWEWWKDSDERRSTVLINSDRYAKSTKKARGDSWFIRYTLIAGDPESAWRILLESGLSFWELRKDIRSALLDKLDCAPVFGGSLSVILMDKCVHDLEVLERKLGVRWLRNGEGRGWHVIETDLEEALERLSSPNFFKTYGYITEGEEYSSTLTSRRSQNSFEESESKS